MSHDQSRIQLILSTSSSSSSSSIVAYKSTDFQAKAAWREKYKSRIHFNMQFLWFNFEIRLIVFLQLK